MARISACSFFQHFGQLVKIALKILGQCQGRKRANGEQMPAEKHKIYEWNLWNFSVGPWIFIPAQSQRTRKKRREILWEKNPKNQQNEEHSGEKIQCHSENVDGNRQRFCKWQGPRVPAKHRLGKARNDPWQWKFPAWSKSSARMLWVNA